MSHRAKRFCVAHATSAPTLASLPACWQVQGKVSVGQMLVEFCPDPKVACESCDVQAHPGYTLSGEQVMYASRGCRLCTLHVAVGGLLLTDALRHTHRAKRKTQPCDIAAHSDGNGGCLQTQYGSSPAQRFATRFLAWGSQRSRPAAWRRSRIRSGRRRRSAPSRSRAGRPPRNKSVDTRRISVG